LEELKNEVKDKKLFIVEFGRPELGFGSMFGFASNVQQPVYVIASDYNEAAEKALAYVEYKRKTTPRNILTDDGSLNPIKDDDEIKVKAVKLAADEIIW
jgi:hypothetical protein